MPETLQGLILARFDRLTPQARQVLQMASVIGKDFNLPVLQTVLGIEAPADVRPAIHELEGREFILPLPGKLDQEYAFRHILMADAIHSTILKKDRSRLHGKVGDAIEQIYADRLEGQIELLANHYRWSPQLDKALHYLLLAGQKAARNNLNEQARQLFENALQMLPNVPPPLPGSAGRNGLRGHPDLRRGLPAARQHYQTGPRGDRPRAATEVRKDRSALHRKIAKTYERQGDYDQAFDRRMRTPPSIADG